jgi:hypothetical protein
VTGKHPELESVARKRVGLIGIVGGSLDAFMNSDLVEAKLDYGGNVVPTIGIYSELVASPDVPPRMRSAMRDTLCLLKRSRGSATTLALLEDLILVREDGRGLESCP